MSKCRPDFSEYFGEVSLAYDVAWQSYEWKCAKSSKNVVNHAFLKFWVILTHNSAVHSPFTMKICRGVEKNMGFDVIPKSAS